MTKQDFKKGEIVTLDKVKHIKENSFNVAFFEKEIETKKNGTIVKEYISIYGCNDKYTKLIRPASEQRFVNNMGDSFLAHGEGGTRVRDIESINDRIWCSFDSTT